MDVSIRSRSASPESTDTCRRTATLCLTISRVLSIMEIVNLDTWQWEGLRVFSVAGFPAKAGRWEN